MQSSITLENLAPTTLSLGDIVFDPKYRRWPMKGHSATSNLSLPEWVDLHERRDAALWKLCYPRNYHVDNHYSSPRQLGAELVGIRVAIDYRDRVPLNERMMLDHSILAGASLVKLRVPIFFVAPDLLKAVQMTVPPVDLDWVNLNLPFERAAFALPRGSLSRATHGDVGYVWYSRIMKDEPLLVPGAVGQEQVAEDDMFFIRASCLESPERPSFQQFMRGSQTPTLNLKDLTGVVGSRSQPESLVAGDVTLTESMTTLIFGLVFAMDVRESLWEWGVYTGEKAKNGAEFWTPNIIGKHYVFPGKGTHGHTGVSPRMHYRRGHMRQQPYGEGRSLRRAQWIEPMLIAAED